MTCRVKQTLRRHLESITTILPRTEPSHNSHMSSYFLPQFYLFIDTFHGRLTSDWSDRDNLTANLG